MVPSTSTTLFEATIPSSSLRPLSRILIALSKLSDELSFEADSTKALSPRRHPRSLTKIGHALRDKHVQIGVWNGQTRCEDVFHGL